MKLLLPELAWYVKHRRSGRVPESIAVVAFSKIDTPSGAVPAALAEGSHVHVMLAWQEWSWIPAVGCDSPAQAECVATAICRAIGLHRITGRPLIYYPTRGDCLRGIEWLNSLPDPNTPHTPKGD